MKTALILVLTVFSVLGIIYALNIIKPFKSVISVIETAYNNIYIKVMEWHCEEADNYRDRLKIAEETKKAAEALDKYCREDYYGEL